MKHFFAQISRPKRRTFLELIGLLFLLMLIRSEWPAIEEAIRDVSHANLFYVGASIATYWLLFPLTAVSYRIISNQQISLWTNSLAQLAGAGPGRILPGGIGRIGIAALHLQRLGFSIHEATLIGIINNMFGLFVNSIALIALLITSHDTRLLADRIINAPILVTCFVFLVCLVAIFQLLLHTKKTRKRTQQLRKIWLHMIRRLRSRPTSIMQLTSIAALILLGNILIVCLSAKALGLEGNFVAFTVSLSIGIFVGSVFPTPGGVGGVEAGIAGTMIALGYTATEATSIAFIYRLCTYWQPIIPGTLAYFYLRERKLM